MIDWGLAQRVADLVAGDAAAEPLTTDLAAMTCRAREDVVAYTRLHPAQPLPPPEAVDRRAWSRANMATMRSTLDPLVEQLLARGGTPGGPLRAAAGAVMAAEVGGVVGFMGRHVLGQYELRLLDPTYAPRLLLVGPNLREAAATMRLELDELVRWVVIHEVTHAVQFGAVPWLRDHVAGLLQELLASVRLTIDPAALLRLPSVKDVRALWDNVREGGLVTAVAGVERKALLDRLQATMALIEGHAEHVMDGAGAATLPSLPRLREALDRRRRERSPLFRIVERLLGLDLKLRQYVVGKAFCDAVVRDWGIDALNRAWYGPEWLPTLAELEAPALWSRRTQARAVPPAA